MLTAWVVLIYGVLVAAGGAYGYARANSLPSLIAGGISGLILIAASVLMMRGAYTAGWWTALIIAGLLLARFAHATLTAESFRFMPGGMMILLSLAAIIALIIGRTPQNP
jgi:uncharacterized membrane protein (UPF0136 family)